LEVAQFPLVENTLMAQLSARQSRKSGDSRRTCTSKILAAALVAVFSSWVGTAMAFVNVSDFGAKGDGKDQTAALQAAINSVPAGGDTIYLPKGYYGVSAPLVISNTQGLRLLGDGIYATVIAPTPAVAGKPVVQFVNTQDSTVEALTVAGQSSGAPSAGIESDATAGKGASHLTVRNVSVGWLSSNTLVNGIVMNAASGATNSGGFFENVAILNFTHAAYAFEHPNASGQALVGGSISYGPIGIYSQGASFKVTGTYFQANDVDNDLENSSDGSVAAYQAPILISDTSSEALAALLRTGTDPMMISMTAIDHKFGKPNVPLIDFENPGMLTINNSYATWLGGAAMTFGGGKQQVINMMNSYFDVGTITMNGGKFSSQNDCWFQNPTVTVSGGALVTQHDSCGTFQMK
jgi:Pectate lyase superfamily protein